ncbi:SRPBCC family protein [Paeniglutamicibacter sp. NPDC091659]|uniref:SRPBCC family protein n=1 Tax=Paeniglutamicibacter sp. NPDC091659 TaxID=3364389 RepID=UPI0038221A75
MNQSPFLQTRSRFVDATPHEVFELLRDPSMHPLIDGSGTVRAALGKGDKLMPGSEFGMQMRMGVPYRISNTVVEFDQDTLLAWRHFSGHRWRYELEPSEGGTLVSETWDASRLRHKWVLRLLGYTRTTGPNMERTLERLAAHFAENKK